MILSEGKGVEDVSKENTDEDPDLLQSLLVNRVVSKNLRSLLKRGGLLSTCGISQCKKRRIPEHIPKAIFISRGFVRQVSV